MRFKPLCCLSALIITLATAIGAAAQTQPTNAYFVVDLLDNNTRIYSVATNQPLETFRFGSTPLGAAVSPDQRLAFFSYINSNYVSIADLTLGAELARIDIGVPTSLALSPDGTILAAAGSTAVGGSGNLVAIINTGTFGVTQVPLGGKVCDNSTPPNCPPQPNIGPLAIAGSNIYVANGGALQVVSVNLNTQQVTPIVGTASADAIAVSPDGRYVIEADQGPTGNGGIGVVDSLTNTLVQMVDTSSTIFPLSMAMTSPVGSSGGVFLFVGGINSSGNFAIQVYSFFGGILSSTSTQLSPLPLSPNMLALSSDGSRLYLAQSQQNSLAIIDSSQPASSLTLLSIQTVGLSISQIAAASIQISPPPSAPTVSNAVAPMGQALVVNNDTDANRTVTISGTNFGQDALVRFGNLPFVTPSSISGSSLQAIVPFQAAAQTANVLVTNPGLSGPTVGQYQSGVLTGSLVIASPPTYQPVNQVLVANFGDNAVATLNVSTNSSVSPEATGFLNPAGAAFTPDGARAYLADFFGGQNGTSIYVYDAVAGALSSTIAISTPLSDEGQSDPIAVVNSPANGGRLAAYVLYGATNLSNPGPPPHLDQVLFIIDADSSSATFNTVVAQIRAPLNLPLFLSGALATTPDGRYAYANEFDISGPQAGFQTPVGNLVIFDTLNQTAAVISCQSLGIAGFQGHIEVTADGGTLLLRMPSGAIGVFDISANPLAPVLLGNITGITPSSPSGLTAPNFYLFRFARSSPNLLVALDSAQNIVEAFNFQTAGTSVTATFLGSLVVPGQTWPAVNGTTDMDLTPDGELIYIVLPAEDDVAVIDGTKLGVNDQTALITKILTGLTPNAVAVRPGTPTAASTQQNPVVIVQPIAAATISLTDSTGGITSVTTTNTTPVSAPSGFQVGSVPVYYNVSTMAGFSTAVVCFTYDPSAVPSPESGLRLAHYNAAIESTTGQPFGWQDVTLPNNPNTTTHTICGQVSSFSPFVIGIASADFMFDSLLIDITTLPNTPPGIMRSLRAKVLNARASEDHGNKSAAANQLNAFISEINSQTGTTVSSSDAQRLINEANNLINQL